MEHISQNYSQYRLISALNLKLFKTPLSFPWQLKDNAGK